MAKFHSPNAGSGAANSGGGGADSGKIRAAHLLVKHNQSRRPMSWKEVRREREIVSPRLARGQTRDQARGCR
jgi:peptidyl-prolyl cis-trans isomerase NIMA-interacting 1